MKSYAFALTSLLGLAPQVSGNIRGVTKKETQTDAFATLNTDDRTKAGRQLNSCETTPFVPDPDKYYTVGGWLSQRWGGTPYAQPMEQWVVQGSSSNDTGSHWRFIPIKGKTNLYYLRNRFTGLIYAIADNGNNDYMKSTALDNDPRRMRFQVFGCSIDSGIWMNMLNAPPHFLGSVSYNLEEVEEDFAKFDDGEPTPYAFDRPEKMLNQLNNELNLALSIGMVAFDLVAAKFPPSYAVKMGVIGGLASAGLSFGLNEFLGGDTTHTAINDAINQFAAEYRQVTENMIANGVTKQLESNAEKTFDGIRQIIYAEGKLAKRLDAFLDPSESGGYLEEFKELISDWHLNIIPLVPDPSESKDAVLARLGFDLLQESMLEGLAYYREHILLQSYFHADFDCEKGIYHDVYTGDDPKSPQTYKSQLEAARQMSYRDWLDNGSSTEKIYLTSNKFKRNGVNMATGPQARDVHDQYVQEITHDMEVLSYKIHYASFDTWEEKTLEQCNAVRNDKLTRAGFSTGLHTLNFVGVNGDDKLATYVDGETYPLLQSPDVSLTEQQHWAFLPVVDGHELTDYFLIQNVYSGTCLGHASGSGRYASVGYAVCNKYDTKQQWSGDLFNTSGRSRIVNNYAGQYLGASGGCNPKSGIRLELQPWLSCGTDGPQQKIPVLQEQPYRVISLNLVGINGNERYATYDENHSYPLIQSLPLDGVVTEKQSWRVLPADDWSFLLQNVYSGTCIGHASGSGSYASVGYFACDKSDTRQQWMGDLFSTAGRSRIANGNGNWYLGANGGCASTGGVRLELQPWLSCGANGPQQNISTV